MTVQVETSGECSGATCTIEPGSSVKFTAPVVDGYRFTGWSGGPECEGISPMLRVEDVTSSLRCTAKYVKRITITGSEGVMVDSRSPFADCKTSTRCVVDEGSGVTLTATQREGYRFAGFSGKNCAGISGEVAKVIAGKEDISCVARYSKTAVVRGVSPTGMPPVGADSDSPFAACTSSACTVDIGGDVTLTAPEVSGFRFTGWSGEGCSGTQTILTLSNVNENISCTAMYGGRVEVRGVIAGAAGSIIAQSDSAFADCSEGSCELDTGSTATLTAPNLEPAFRFAGWTGQGCEGTGLNLTLANVGDSVLCTGHYVARFTVTGLTTGTPETTLLTATSSDAFAACSGNLCRTDEGGSVTLTAPTVPGFRFVRFTGSGCGNESGSSVTVSPLTGNTTCTATYAPGIAVIGNLNVQGAPSTVLASSSELSATCTGSGCILTASGDVTLLAPDLEASGYRFDGWTGDPGCDSTARSLGLLDVDESMTCLALYVSRFRVAGTAAPANAGSVAATSTDAEANCSSSQCQVDAGAAVDLRANAQAGYRFTGWSGGGACSGSNPLITIANVTANVSCTANFIARHAVSIPDPSQGSITPSNFPLTTTCTSTSCTVDTGSSLRLTARANPGFRFRAWSGCSTSSDPVLNLSAIGSDLSCVANFNGQWTVSSTLTGAPAGAQVTASASAGSPAAVCTNAAGSAGSCVVDEGLDVTLTANSVAGYALTGWSGTGCTDSGSDGNLATLLLSNVTASRTCTPVFATLRTVSAVSNNPALGTVDVSSVDSLAVCTAITGGEQCVVRNDQPATLDPGLAAGQTVTSARFTGWSGDCTGTSDPLNLAQVNVDTDCTANFSARFTIASALSGAPTGADVDASASAPSPASTCTNGTASAGGCNVDSGVSVLLTATPVAGYLLTGWTGSGCADSGSDGNVATLLLSSVAANRTCTPVYTALRTVRAVSNNTALGTVNVSSSDASAACSAITGGEQCVVRNNQPATLDPGLAAGQTATSARFTGWSGDCTGTSDPLNLAQVNVDTDCTANFSARFTIASALTGAPKGADVDASASAPSPASTCTNGSASAGSCNVDAGLSVTLTANAVSGYSVTGWTGSGCTDSGSDGNVATLLLSNVTGNYTCTPVYTVLRTVSAVSNNTTLGTVNVSSSDASAACSAITNGEHCVIRNNQSATLDPALASGQTATSARFSGWSGDCTGTSDPLNISQVSADTDCTANFVARFTVAAALSGAPTGADVDASASAPAPASTCVNGTASAGSCNVDAGLSVTLTASTVAGFSITGWTGTGCTDSGSDGNIATLLLSNVTTNRTCTPVYTGLRSVSAVSNNTTLGTVGVSSSDTSATCSAITNGERCVIRNNQPATLDPALASGQTATSARFSGWSGDCSGTSDPLNISQVSADTDCTANFVARFTVAAALSGAPTGADVDASASAPAPASTCVNGTASAGSCNVDAGLSVTLTANPITGYLITGWTGTGCTDSGNDADVATLLLSNVTANRTCTPTYVPTRAVSAVSNNVTLGTVHVSSTDSSAECSAITNGERCVVRNNQPASIDAGLTAGQTASTARFTGWSGDCSGTSDPFNIAQVSSDMTCTANFSARFTVVGAGAPLGAISASSTQGSPLATCSGATCTVDSGVPVTLTAPDLVNSNYVFKGWSGAGCTDSNADQNPLTLQIAAVSADATCTAIYYAIIQVGRSSASAISAVSITNPGLPSPATCTGLGTGTGAILTRCELPIGTTVRINAPDASAARFVDWSGSSGCAGAASHALTLDAPKFCNATFYGLWGRTYQQAGGTAGSSLLEGSQNNLLLVGRGTYTDPAGLRSSGASLDTVGEHSGALLTPTSDPILTDDKMTGVVATDIDGDPSAFAIVGQTMANPAAPYFRIRSGATTTDYFFRASSAHAMDDIVAVPGVGYAAIGTEAAVNPETGADQRVGRLIAIDESGAKLIANRRLAILNTCTVGVPATSYPTRTVGVAPHFTGGNFDGWVTVQVANIPSDVLRGVSFAHTFIALLNPSGALQRIDEWTDRDAANGATFPLDANGVVGLSDGSFVLYGQRVEALAASTTFDGFWIRFSPTFQLIDGGRIGSAGLNESFAHATETTAGGVALVGRTVQVQRTDLDAWFVKLRKDGVIETQATYSSTVNDNLNRIRALSLGGFGMHGTLVSNSAIIVAPPPPVAWALRSDDDGFVPFVAQGAFTLFTPAYQDLGLNATASKVDCMSSVDGGDPRISIGMITVDPTTTEGALAP